MAFTPKIISQTFWRLRRWSRKVWVRSALIGSLSLVAVASSSFLSALVPDALEDSVTVEALGDILKIVATGMLSVVIFSLSVMVSARQSASSQVTPRSHQILLEDTTTQNVLATFLGAFLFSLVGLITLGTHVYSGKSVTVMLIFTIIVIALVVVSILRWIAHLTNLGSMIETTRKVEHAAEAALETWMEMPSLGATGLVGDPVGREVKSKRAGYVQHIAMQKLSDLAEEADGKIAIIVRPGGLVSEGDTVMHVTGDIDDDALCDALSLGDSRVFDQDPRFGIIVLSEIGQRALSPGINDPGTAIDVLTRQQRILTRWGNSPMALDKDREPAYPRLYMEPLSAEGLMRDAFDPIARDGAAQLEVHIRLQKVLAALAKTHNSDLTRAARDASRRSMERAFEALTLEADRERLRRVMARLPALHSAAS
ncbi:DUF2254 domain-containing protein [Oceaniglobus trochenteri]|uniref:DUF2254 domain-containing protein n=1 Tax=Oceaniglobus trochenteri TaxID=2763260 RepID=UPI001CFFC807|nr:DUF2254 domain-containing protein [Oceaniglobus trochenteri]